MPAEEVREEYTEAAELAETTDGVELVEASHGIDQQIHLNDYRLSEVLELGQSLGVQVFYGHLEEADDGTPEWSRLFFIRDGICHVQYIESLEMEQIREVETDEQVGELERKEELAEELLETYSEVMSEAQRYRLEHNVDDMRMDRLFGLQDQLQNKKEQIEREERIDEDLEKELAEALVDEERFNRQFNEGDTEMLLHDMDVEFEDDEIRVGEVHRQAKSLLKINQ